MYLSKVCVQRRLRLLGRNCVSNSGWTSYRITGDPRNAPSRGPLWLLRTRQGAAKVSLRPDRNTCHLGPVH